MKASTAPTSVATQSPDERRKIGVALRRATPRSAQADWRPPADRPDPVAILIERDKTRIPDLLAIRYARMRTDPFAFLRGAAAIMSSDLAGTPATGYRVQASGDAHLANFGAYASPEGTPVFDINDFDESLPAPFEWDIKRLAASLVVAGLVEQCSANGARNLAHLAVHAYRQHMAALARLSPMTVWNSRIDLRRAVADIEPARARAAVERRLARALDGAEAHFGLIDRKAGGLRISDKPPLVYRLDEHAPAIRKAFTSYGETLQEDRKVLLRRHALRDVAFKAVGIGSVGTFCAIALLEAGDGSPLLLQIKQAGESVLAPFAGPSTNTNPGERVVVGQRMMQAASDILLGWTLAPIEGRYFYVRQVKDPQLAELGDRLEAALPFYAGLCGRTLARAHARAGDPALISGYLGKSAAFDEAVADFAVAYAAQTEADWRAFKAAIKAGRIVSGASGTP